MRFVLRAFRSRGRVQSKGGTASDSSCLLEGGFKGGETRETRAQTRGRLGTEEQGGACMGTGPRGDGGEHCFQSDFGGQMEHS